MLKATGKFLTVALIALGAGTAAAATHEDYDDSDYYGSDCHSDNATAGTVVGAIAGGIIGNQFGHGGGKVAATVGGVVLGGVAGNAIGKSIDCGDRPYAYPAYRRGFDGPVGDDYEWQHDDAHGYMCVKPPLRAKRNFTSPSIAVAVSGRRPPALRRNPRS